MLQCSRFLLWPHLRRVPCYSNSSTPIPAVCTPNTKSNLLGDTVMCSFFFSHCSLQDCNARQLPKSCGTASYRPAGSHVIARRTCSNVHEVIVCNPYQVRAVCTSIRITKMLLAGCACCRLTWQMDWTLHSTTLTQQCCRDRKLAKVRTVHSPLQMLADNLQKTMRNCLNDSSSMPCP